MSIASYRWARYLQHGAMVAEPLYPVRSIAAGSTPATFELRCFLVRLVGTHVATHSSIDLCIHIDDLCQESSKCTDDALIDTLADSAEDLATALAQVGLELALPELQCVSNSLKAAHRLVRRLKDIGGAAVEEALHLGVDFALALAARARGPRGATRGERLRSFIGRSTRLEKLLATARSGWTGLQGLSSYVSTAAAVISRSWAPLRRLRGKQAAPEPPQRPGNTGVRSCRRDRRE